MQIMVLYVCRFVTARQAEKRRHKRRLGSVGRGSFCLLQMRYEGYPIVSIGFWLVKGLASPDLTRISMSSLGTYMWTFRVDEKPWKFIYFCKSIGYGSMRS